MSGGIEFSLNLATVREIAMHLSLCDTTFVPPLSERVEIDAYAIKIVDKAVRFEAWEANDLVGLVAVYCDDHERRSAFITSVSVLPVCQRKNIATQLMLQCARYVTDLGFTQLELEVNLGSVAAIELYKKFGFRLSELHGQKVTMRLDLC